MVNSIKRATRRDVASAAGVSEVVVTYSFSDTPKVRMSDATRHRILQVAREMGYRPNFFHKARISGKSFTIGLLQPEPCALFNHFYQHIVYALAQAMNADGYDVLHLYRGSDERYLHIAREGRIDGMVVLQSDAEDGPIRQLAESKIPLVVVNRLLAEGVAGSVAVCADHAKVIESMMNDALSVGCAHLTYFNTNACSADQELFAAFQAGSARWIDSGVLATHVLPVREKLQAQAESLVAMATPKHAILTDGKQFTDAILDAAARQGRVARRDFHLYACAMTETDLSASGEEDAAFVQDAEALGQHAWAQMCRILSGDPVKPVVRFPYRKRIRHAPNQTTL